MTDLITHTPASVAPGDQVKICYAFPQGGPNSITLTLDYSDAPNGTITVTRENPCAWTTVPPKATSLIVTDPTGQSEDHNVPIT